MQRSHSLAPVFKQPHLFPSLASLHAVTDNFGKKPFRSLLNFSFSEPMIATSRFARCSYAGYGLPAVARFLSVIISGPSTRSVASPRGDGAELYLVCAE